MPEFARRRTMMVDTQVRPSDVTKYPIIAAMLHVPRERYVPGRLREAAYTGENLSVAPGRMLLAPRTFAKLLDALEIDSQDVILDVGCLQGYSTAVLAHMAEFVVALEEEQALADEAEAILSEQEVDNAAVLTGPLAEGAAKSGPYDAILIEGAVDQVPAALTDQLKELGRIAAVFVQGANCTARCGTKIDGVVHWRDLFHAGAPVLPGFHAEQSFAL
ncbi:protein-L-isoaspartate O-methyltransferase family protein [Pseudoroseicyclus tamaricis]|uniref:Protein-L-isoaspartate O-methyltransferase n=1 Tax=Pseudoroseicyclus tamaricis TaxID=2705421 RepID=A0A6B2K1A6_9RHOB|nr:protein-L-isoaspartate O-methyltransferase [Pseudoroseicyclus tamaricis]NDV01492.1 protein-L-isoaspartate O-methyltransferase [Pseudoroseicyclus tamaricis]